MTGHNNLKEQPDNSLRDNNFCSFEEFYRAIEKKNLNTLQQLSYPTSYLNYFTEKTYPPLLAVLTVTKCRNDPEAIAVVSYLIEKGADILLTDEGCYFNYKGNALHKAATTCNVEMMRLLVNHAKDQINSLSIDGKTPLHYVVRLVTENERNKECKPANYYLNKKYKIEMVRYLLDVGADVSIKDKKGRTPLHYARDYEIYEMLLEAGADVNAPDNENNTPLHLIDYGLPDAMKSLGLMAMKYNANLSAFNLSFQQPKDIAGKKSKKYFAKIESYERSLKPVKEDGETLPLATQLQGLEDKINELLNHLNLMHKPTTSASYNPKLWQAAPKGSDNDHEQKDYTPST